MKEVWVNKAGSFDDARRFEKEYYKKFSASQRLETVQVLREAFFRSSGISFRGNRKRLRRVFEIIKQA